MRLLLGESTKSIIKLVGWICEEEQVELEVVKNTDELTKAIEGQAFDIICLAQTIDSDNGIPSLKMLRSDNRFTHIPIFLFSASPKHKQIHRALSEGATDLINKSEFENFSYFLARHKQRFKPLSAKIMVVEDSPSQQLVLGNLLESLGCEVDLLTNAEQAIKQFESENYDLVVTDVILEGMSTGAALAGKIRRIKSIKGDVPIIAITSLGDPAREASLYNYGVTEFFRKPVNEADFARHVKSLVTAFQEHQLIHQNSEELARSDTQRIQFWASLSHELRTPLNGLIGSLQLISSDDVNKDKADYLELAKGSSEMLMSLLNDVLDLTRAESNNLQYSIKRVELEPLLKQQIGTVKNLADEKGIAISYETTVEVPAFIGCDKTRLNQVVINMLHNAIKFTQQGQIRLVCQLDKSHSKSLCFRIFDTGEGISKADQANVFVKFKQANKDIERRFGGTGLGLHIAKLIVSMWGGEIGVNSELGKGSEFWFTLPIKDTQLEELPESIEIEFSDPASRRILLVDDNEVNQVIAKGLLELCELKVELASSAQEALQKLKIAEFDFVFMDINMPEMCGIDATQIIRNETNPSIPIVALTASSASEVANEALAAGMNDVLEKPVMLESLIEKLNKFLG